MSFLWRAIKAQILWAQLKSYQEEKQAFWPQKRDRRPTKPSLMKSFYRLMRTKKTPENFLWIGIQGFLGGIVISWTFFAFCIIAFRMPLKNVTWGSVAMATFLSFSLSVSSTVRCYVLLLLPQLFSKRGRQALTAYAFILSVSGPAGNAVHNLGVLSNSMACGQEQIKRSMKQVVDMIKEPIAALTTSLKKLKADIKDVVQPIKDVVSRIIRAFKAVFGVIKSVASWLGSIVSICNKKTGSPYNRCVKSLDDAMADCQVKLGVMKFLCSIVSIVKPLCLPVKIIDALCSVMDMISDAIVGVAKRRLAVFRMHIVDLLAVSIEIHHSINMTDTSSKSVRDVVKAVVSQVENRVKNIKFLFKISIIVPGFAFILLFLKVYHYRHKFFTADHFDNRYINRVLVEIDLARVKRNLPTVLPLELNERKIYTSATSVRLVHGERKRLLSAFLFLTITTIQVSIYLAVDYAIYWTELMIRQQGLDAAVSLDMPEAGIKVQGAGTMADLYKRLGESFKPPAPMLELDPVPCLPEPMPPDLRRYAQIGVLLLASWFLTLLEPYCLRFRHIVLSKYHPERGRQRAVWLHNHILLSRGPFTVFARNQMINRLRNRATAPAAGTIFQKIVHRSIILRRVFGSKIVACAVCATAENVENKLINCISSQCKALYCHECLETLSKCVLCYDNLRSNITFDILDQAINSSDEESSELYSESESGLPSEQSSSDTNHETRFSLNV